MSFLAVDVNLNRECTCEVVGGDLGVHGCERAKGFPYVRDWISSAAIRRSCRVGASLNGSEEGGWP